MQLYLKHTRQSNQILITPSVEASEASLTRGPIGSVKRAMEKATVMSKITLKTIFFVFVILVAASLPVAAEPSPTAQLSDLQEGRTTSPPKLVPTSSSIIPASSVAALTAIANLVTNTGEKYKTDVIALKISYIWKEERQN